MVKIKYFDRIHKELLELEVSEEVAETLAEYNLLAKTDELNSLRKVISLDKVIDKIRTQELDFDFEDSIQAKEEREIMLANLPFLIRRLTSKQRLIIAKRFYSKKTEKQIANEMGCSQPTIHVQLYDSYKKMKKFLKNTLLNPPF